MVRPLYKAASKEPTTRQAGGHAGLWYDKFCDQWRRDDNTGWSVSAEQRGSNPKLDWIQSVAARGAVGISDQIDEYALRVARLVSRRGGRLAAFTTDSRFVTGLGRNHPVENGFAWHPTLGTPYLPGSSIKGMVRAWAQTQAEPQADESTAARLFGSADGVGGIGFLDAVPVAPVALEADIMTPHYAAWDANEPPGDWRSPTPIPFLVTPEGVTFLFAIVPLRAVPDAELDSVFAWLHAALEWAGAGAKTAVGYGRFRHNEDNSERWSQRLLGEEAVDSPEARWRLEISKCSEGAMLGLVRRHLAVGAGLEDAAERAAFARAVLATDMVEHWRRGQARDSHTQLGKKKLKERVRLLEAAISAEGSGDVG